MRSVTLAKSPRRNAWRSTIEKNTSTKMSQDAEGRGEVQLDTRVLAQPAANDWVLVGGVVVTDHVQLPARRRGAVSHVVMGALLGPVQPDPAARLSAFQGLDLGLLIHARCRG
jgi:hypothetical protein